MALIETDIAIIVYSRGREDCLTRLLDDLRLHYVPALKSGGLSACVWVYAQHYPDAYLAEVRARHADPLATGELVLLTAEVAHGRIGDVAHAAIRTVHRRSAYRLAMLMDDDSTYHPDQRVCSNLRQAARTFIETGHAAYSIKLGDGDALAYGPFVDLAGPIMPFKEKMLWVSRDVLDEALDVPRFAELSLGEDAVIAAVAWLSDPDGCFAVQGLGTFRHLGFEPGLDLGPGTFGGGYAELMGFDARRPDVGEGTKYDEALRTGVTPHHVLPHIFVPEAHPHYAFNGIRPEAIAALRRRPPANLAPSRVAALNAPRRPGPPPPGSPPSAAP